ncbi:SWIM zinc finger family protein [Streptomyces sp. Je 1-369]|uniref:SWIM zinc finger family protein n=1 Tax=Streptomyces sp. Je 1-369 TaxID=2966192 RepID=UPI0039E19984
MSETSRMGSGRVFPALPKHPDPGAPFATSWWGNAWIDALEESALDQARLARGRTYAREGAVDTITVAPGRIVAYVHGSRPRPYRAEIRMRTMLPEHWDRFLDVVATDPVRIAALLDKEMPHALAAAADRADVPLLPGARELTPSCTCPDRGHPCKHAAALAYQTARLLDADPFVLLLLRGGEEQDLLDELSRRNARRGAAEAAESLRGAGAAGEVRGAEEDQQPSPHELQPPTGGGPVLRDGQQSPLEGGPVPSGGQQPPPDSVSARPGDVQPSPASGPVLGDGEQSPPTSAPVLPGVLAREALGAAYRSPLPAPLPPPSYPGESPVLPVLPGAPDPTALEFLITDAARRAHTFLTASATAVADADPFPVDASPWHDAVRLAASHPGLTGRRTFSRQFGELARSVGRTAADLSRAAAAWRQGGEAGLAALETPWDPPAGPFDRARGALVAADLPRMTIHRNQLTDAEGTLQLRYGTDGRWYPYRSEPGGGDWWPEGEADIDPVGALAGVTEA